jgi:glycosyltransferase involved in cell wall biosynthesis
MLKDQHIICVSMTFWDAVWLSNHQYMKRLSTQNKVLYVERPVTLLSYLSPNQRPFVSRQLRRWWKDGIRQEGENLYVASPPPVIPMRFEKPINTVNQLLRGEWIRRVMKKLNFEAPILWIYDPDAGRLVGQLGEKLALYAVTDDHLSMTQRSNRVTAMRARERELIAACDLVITTTENLRDTKKQDNPNTYYVPHGIDADHFAKAMSPDTQPMPELANLSAPMIGIVGQINQRIDIHTMTAMAIRHPEWNLIFIGPVVRERVDVSELERLPNVHFLGRKSAEDLPRYLKSISVCLIPYIVDEHTTYMHPLKTLEYLAAGKPVVSTPLPALSIYGDTIRIAGDTDSFIAAVEQALATDSPAEQARRVAYAQGHTWESRLESISGLIEGRLAEKQNAIPSTAAVKVSP